MGLTWGIVTFVFYLRIYFCCHFVFFICFKDFHNERGVSLWSPFCSDFGISICFIFPYLCWGISFFPFYMGSGDWTQSSGFPDFACWTVLLELNFSLWQLSFVPYSTPEGTFPTIEQCLMYWRHAVEWAEDWRSWYRWMSVNSLLSTFPWVPLSGVGSSVWLL